jgi:hypothetical protein
MSDSEQDEAPAKTWKDVIGDRDQTSDKESQRKRLLKKQVRSILQSNPNIKPLKPDQLDDKLNEMSANQMEEMLDNMHMQLGGLKPFGTASAIMTIVGYAAEWFFTLPGYRKRLSKNTRLLALTESVMPDMLEDVSAPLQIAKELLEEVIHTTNKDEEEDNTTRPSPESKKSKKRARSASPSPPPKRRKEALPAEHYAPDTPPCGGEMSDGENH